MTWSYWSDGRSLLWYRYSMGTERLLVCFDVCPLRQGQQSVPFGQKQKVYKDVSIHMPYRRSCVGFVFSCLLNLTTRVALRC